jgi:K+ transporter
MRSHPARAGERRAKASVLALATLGVVFGDIVTRVFFVVDSSAHAT